ncbi:thioredoxin-disulfide reductase [Patescibacteria group bacterium]|nr:thioredoxin-disulfide reductase [Patescibacteria group bacterium]MBU1682874.1 thioredoxin-disulfide reductase [Patescibacteria group bacterium]
MDNIYDVIIIGSGPAGHTAAVYTSRAELKTLVFEGWQPGGQLTITTEVENFPGFSKGIYGQQLMTEMKAQAERFGTKYISKDITKVDFSSRPFKVYTGDEEYQSKAVIIATGAKPRRLGLPSEDRLWAKGVSACATCDGFFFKDKVVAVLGGGDSAMEEAGFLTKFATKVYLIHRREEFRSSKIMEERVKANEKIEILTNKAVDEVLGENNVTGLRLKDTKTDETSEITVDGMFLAIGHIPATDLFRDQIELDKVGFILHKENTMTSIPGVFAAGDVVDHRYRQAITAAGMGCAAAIDVERWLAE